MNSTDAEYMLVDLTCRRDDGDKSALDRIVEIESLLEDYTRNGFTLVGVDNNIAYFMRPKDSIFDVWNIGGKKRFVDC